MPRPSFRYWLIVAAALASVAGCASIISGRRSDVTFDTYPPGAHVDIRDKSGRPVSSFDAPGAVTLKRQGRFFMPAHYTATITAPGYQTAQVPIGSTLNPWLLGNIVIGGVPGIVIDSATGAAWKPKRSEIHQQLMPLEGPEELQGYSAAQPESDDNVVAAQYTEGEPATASNSDAEQRRR
jgi:hypothetical protein